ncbi:MAG: translesion DNA synthesis-associated protein ImuA [Gammaproteobacteria bacterium]|nr:translesion DNA synthesis-associated protein ImuA [Gammaproteobacteria bacterium]MDH3811559.1 translesion DNA synthesis-associated protein ImuA [Gammaproteobacteria bacterium]
MSSSLDKILANPRVWRGRDQAGRRAGLASGYPELDRHLPGGGWPRESLTEVLTEHYGIGELRLLMPALARLSTETSTQDFTEPGWIAWVAPPFQPYPPALQQCGIDLSRMLIVRPRDDSEILWSAEQALSSGTCAAVLLWPSMLDDQASRRLQLAAEKGRSWAIAFRPLAARRQPSAAALRLELHPDGQATRVHILKSRGGRPAVITQLL